MILFLLGGCFKQENWQSDLLLGIEPSSSGRLLYAPNQGSYGLGLEIVQYPHIMEGYVNLYSNQAPTGQLIDVKVETEGQTFIEKGFLLQGGQRVLLADETTKFITQSLMDKQSITIEANGIEQVVHPESFIKKLKHIQKEIVKP